MEQLLAQLPLLLLVLARIGGLVFASPVFSKKVMPGQLRAAFTFLLAVILYPVATAEPWALEGTGLLLAAILETLVGITMGFVGQIIFAAVQMAGALLDLDMGFALAQIFDPISGHSQTVVSTFFQMLTLVVYFGLNAHHWLIRSIAESYMLVSAGGLVINGTAPLYLVTLFGTLFTIAIQMILPFITVMLLTSMALAGMSRAVPQMHIFAIGMGVKAVTGLVILTMMLPYLSVFLENLFAMGHTELLRTLELMR